VSSNW